MAYCPNCRAEYRAGFEVCSTCKGVQLVDQLPEVIELKPEDIMAGRPVGLTNGEAARLVEVDGRKIDPQRVFTLDTASELKSLLDEAAVPSAIVPLEEIEFPDNRPRFELRVRADDLSRAEDVLFKKWREQVEAEGVSGQTPTDVEHCPACGAHVPLNVEECPDCGLVIGAGGEGEENVAGV